MLVGKLLLLILLPSALPSHPLTLPHPHQTLPLPTGHSLNLHQTYLLDSKSSVARGTQSDRQNFSSPRRVGRNTGLPFPKGSSEPKTFKQDGGLNQGYRLSNPSVTCVSAIQRTGIYTLGWGKSISSPSPEALRLRRQHFPKSYPTPISQKMPGLIGGVVIKKVTGWLSW